VLTKIRPLFFGGLKGVFYFIHLWVVDNVSDGDRCHRQCLWWWPVLSIWSLMVTNVVDNVFDDDRCRWQSLMVTNVANSVYGRSW